MGKVVIIYWSGTGNTELMAQAVLEGAEEINADTKLFNVSEITAGEALEYDTLILGCPAMGAEVLEESEFEPFFSELENGIEGKNIALFGSYAWGDGEWMRNWEERIIAAKAKLITQSVIVNETPDDVGLENCRELGKTVAKE